MAKADYGFATEDHFLLIWDSNKGNISVTNDIETVIKEVSMIVWKTLELRLLHFRVMYKDSEGIIDGVRICDDQFDSFYGIGTKDFQEACLNSRGMVLDSRGKLLS